MNFLQDLDLKVKTIDHKFCVSGHLFLSSDHEFGIIESDSRKCSNIFTPNDWFDLRRKAKTKKSFKVNKIETPEILSSKKIEEQLVSRKKTYDGLSVKWL